MNSKELKLDASDANDRQPSVATNEAHLWTVADVARYVNCSERHVWNLRRSGLPSVKVGALVRFEPEAIKEWLRSGGEVVTDERARQLKDIARHSDGDATECAAADLAREFPAGT